MRAGEGGVRFVDGSVQERTGAYGSVRERTGSHGSIRRLSSQGFIPADISFGFLSVVRW